MRAWKRYEWQGRMLTIEELAKLSGIPPQTLRRRLAIGWSTERAMTEKLRHSARWN